MQQSLSDSIDFCQLSSNHKQSLQFPLLGIMNKELEQIMFQCNIKLLQQKVIMLFGFPSIKVDSERIYKYLKGIKHQSHFEQLKKIRTLISFIGESTQITNWNERVHIISLRVQQFFNIKGLQIQWSELQWKNEIDSIFTFRTNNLYYDTIPNKVFSYLNLFNTIGIKLPSELQNLQHQTINQIQTSNLTDDFNFLCDIDEFNIIRNFRIFIQKLINQFNGFMDLLLKIETKNNVDLLSIKHCYQTLCQELYHILISYTPKHIYDEHSTNSQKQTLILNFKPQEKHQSLVFKKIPIPTTSLTTIIQGNFQSKSKQQKKKIKQEQHLYQRSSIIDYSLDQYKNNQIENKSKIIYYDDNNDLIQKLQNQLINNVSFFNHSINSDDSFQKIQQKILTYEYLQYKLEQVGYPCISLNENDLIQVLQDHKLYNKDKTNLIIKLINIISESFISRNSDEDVTEQLRQQTLKYLLEIKIDIPKQELNQILNEQCITKQKMSIYDNLQNKTFSYEVLSQIIDRKFPEQINQMKCLSTKIIFQQCNIQSLLDIFNFQELQNIRVLRQYIYEIYTSLQTLINFKQQSEVDFDSKVVQEFRLMEKQFLNVLNQSLNFQVDSNQVYFQNQYVSEGEFDELFCLKLKDQFIQKQDFNIIKDQPIIRNRNKEFEQIYEQNNDQSNQDVFYMLNLDQSPFDLQYSPNQWDSTRFNFMNNGQQQLEDLEYITSTEFCSLQFSK
ncbi:unnamed protein product [Paramecium pentaurelia]|uniref:Uncharacterized protein n=1 Tax=Paramecium pentaurelia TaxID=43138 RepID=A0A8S1S712_9CILI|nr:unnamed protein product [Paramecium pentaurelia]